MALSRYLKKQPRGFTMVEVLSVMVVLSLLAAIIMPRLWVARDKSTYTGCQQNLKSIATALQLYANDNDHVFPATLSLVQPQYLKLLPTCASAQSDTYSPSYQRLASPSSFTVYCQGSNHLAVPGIVADQPYYVYGKGGGP